MAHPPYGNSLMTASQPALRAKLAALEEQGVRYGLASFVDLHGRPKCKAVPIGHFEQMLGGLEPALKPDFLEKPAYDVRLLLNSLPVIDELVAAMNTLGWDVYSFDQEDALGQFETDFAYCDALTMADRFTFFRLMAGQIAAKHGMFASFMPKPLANRTGSGAHYNMSLASAESGANLFVNEKDPRGCGLSQLGYQFIAGVLRHAKAICAVIAPTVNSY